MYLLADLPACFNFQCTAFGAVSFAALFRASLPPFRRSACACGCPLLSQGRNVRMHKHLAYQIAGGQDAAVVQHPKGRLWPTHQQAHWRLLMMLTINH